MLSSAGPNRRYEIKEKIGQGGMGEVYRAYDRTTKRDVTIKTLKDFGDQASLDQFRHECQVLASLNHSNIVDIYDIGEAEGQPYFVMPLLPGQTLAQLLETSRLTTERVVDIISQTCRGLQAAHERGLVHRDLKPSNIFVLPGDSVKIIDFGVASMVDRQSTMRLKGTLLYMAPEQTYLKAPTAQSDLFSLGVVCYEALTGRRPFDGSTQEQVVNAIRKEIPPPASDLNPEVNQKISQVIHKVMAKQPSNRFATAQEYSACLQKAMRNEPIEYFDETRIQARLERVREAIQQQKHELGSEILTSLEAETYHPEVTRLRRQIDQSVREKTISRHLESARQRFDVDEYDLALQWVQKILELDSANPDALGLKREIETRRSKQQIEDWFRLAHQHMENHAYSHARQALENVLQLHSTESRALDLLSEVERREQDYKRVQREKQKLYQAALDALGKGELSSALSKLERVIEFDSRAPDTMAPERQKLYNRVRSEHEALNDAYEQARRHRTEKNYDKALAVCQDMLAKYPGHALFQALKFDVEADRRQELSSSIAKIDREVQAEPDLERQIKILSEACGKYPGESHFEQRLQTVKSKSDLVKSIVLRARNYEEAGKFTEALGQWQTLQTIYAEFPGLDFEIHRVVKRQELQARSEAKIRWVEQIEESQRSGDWARALKLVGSALAEFPDDPELQELEGMVRQGMERTAEAQQLLERGQALLEEPGSIDEGLDVLRQAHALDERNARIRKSLLDALLRQARALIDSDWRAAEPLVQQAVDLDSSDRAARGLLPLIADRKRGEVVDQCISEARRLQRTGDIKEALDKVQEGLASYPHEARLRRLQSTLSEALREKRSSPTRRRDLGRVQDLARDAAQVRDRRRLESIVEQTQAIAQAHSGDSDFETIVADMRSRLSSVDEPVAPAEPGEADESEHAVPRAPEELTLPMSALEPGEAGAHASPSGSPGRAGSAAPAPGRAGHGPWQAVLAPLTSLAGKIGVPPWLLLLAPIVLAALLGGLVFWSSTGAPEAVPLAAAVPVQISTSPAGALVRIDDADLGASPVQQELEPGEHHLEVRMDGYESVARSFQVDPAFPSTIDLALNPLPASVQFFTDLDAGEVSVDEEPRGALEDGELQLDGLSAGAHQIDFAAPRGLKATLSIVAEPGGPPVLAAPAEVRNLKAVVVSSLGKRAVVYSSFGPLSVRVDGKEYGEAGAQGLALQDLQPGVREFIIQQSGEQRTMLVELGPQPSLAAFLYSDRDVGHLSITVNEPGVTVLIDGRRHRYSERNGKIQLYNLLSGNRKVTVRKEGYRVEPEQQVAEIQKGQVGALEFSLVRIPQIASLLIRGAPPDAEVFLDGKLQGSVDVGGTFTKGDVPAGSHTLELRKKGYRTKSFSRSFTAEGVVELTGQEVNLAMAVGVLNFNISPASSQLEIDPSIIEAEPFQGRTRYSSVPGRLELQSGIYNLTFKAPGHADQTVNVQLADGESKLIPVELKPLSGSQRVQAAAAGAGGMEGWEDPSGWQREEDWYVRRGGDFVLYSGNISRGVFRFSVRLPSPLLGAGKPLNWFVEYRDRGNHILFGIDKKNFHRFRVVNGAVEDRQSEPHGLDSKEDQTIEVEISSDRIVHRVKSQGGESKLLDSWDQPAGTLGKGRFGFRIPADREMKIKDFQFEPR